MTWEIHQSSINHRHPTRGNDLRSYLREIIMTEEKENVFMRRLRTKSDTITRIDGQSFAMETGGMCAQKLVRVSGRAHGYFKLK